MKRETPMRAVLDGSVLQGIHGLGQVADRVCKAFDFRDGRGRWQRASCCAALADLEAAGHVSLPRGRPSRGGVWRPRVLPHPVAPAAEVPGTVGEVRDLALVRVETDEQRRVWNTLMAHEHPRGAGPFVGPQLRYLVGSGHGWLGGVGFAACARRLRARDAWIGWDDTRRRAHLHRVLDRVFLSAKALDDLPGKDILQRLNSVFETLDLELQRIAKDLEQALARADEGVALVRTKWETRKKAVQEVYEKILRELQKSRVDGEEFIRLRRQIEELRPLRERQASARRTEKEHADRRRSLLAEWEDFKAQEFRRLAGAAKGVNKKLRDRAQVEVAAAGDREPLFNLLRDKVGGRLSEAIESLRGVRDLSLTQFVEACRSGAEPLNKTFGITPAQGERLAKAEPEVLMRVEELDLPPTTTIRLNTAPAGEPPAWQALEDLSTGQKATAVLLLLLLESEAPLIVDQPEDDLDNRFITEGVVPRMREEKQRRLFLFSTHNANIPVLGDAELIVGLSATGEAAHGRARIAPEHMGSIDAKPVRELVEEILEGGKEAFERRRRKYGF